MSSPIPPPTSSQKTREKKCCHRCVILIDANRRSSKKTTLEHEHQAARHGTDTDTPHEHEVGRACAAPIPPARGELRQVAGDCVSGAQRPSRHRHRHRHRHRRRVTSPTFYRRCCLRNPPPRHRRFVPRHRHRRRSQCRSFSAPRRSSWTSRRSACRGGGPQRASRRLTNSRCGHSSTLAAIDLLPPRRPPQRPATSIESASPRRGAHSSNRNRPRQQHRRPRQARRSRPSSATRRPSRCCPCRAPWATGRRRCASRRGTGCRRSAPRR